MPKAKFLETCVVAPGVPVFDGDDGKGMTFEADEVYDLSENSFARWLRRGKIEAVADKKPSKGG